MRYVLAQEGETISLGKQGENEVETVRFDVSGWADEYGVGTFTLLHQRCCDGDGVERDVTMSDDGKYLLWLITSTDVAVAGKGRLQLTYAVNDAVAKSIIFTTKTMESLGASEEVPLPWKPWFDQVMDARDDAVAAAENATESETSAERSATNASISEGNAEHYAQQSSASAESALESETRARMYYGAPLIASAADEMTDTTRIYVYTGSETEYVNGNWYYWDGTAWTSGGVYNSNGEDTATNADIDALLYS